ncbi:MAG: hypothetical protein KDD56_10690, partial [Bdellovibrionales bacterium]|nr:hypothetical protein [Bdellovibrionales bacterium]
MKLKFKSFLTPLIFISLAFSSCSVSNSEPNPNSGLIDKLKGQGPVALSADNPFIASNLLVERESEKSEVLKGFVNHRGLPAAIEIEEGYFSPMLMHFYYMDKREMYNFEKLDDIWVIKGPFDIEAEKMTKVRLETRGNRNLTTSDAQDTTEVDTKENNKAIIKKETTSDPIVEALNRIEN